MARDPKSRRLPLQIHDEIADQLASDDANQRRRAGRLIVEMFRKLGYSSTLSSPNQHGESHKGGDDDVATVDEPLSDVYAPGIVGSRDQGYSPGNHQHPSHLTTEGGIIIGGPGGPTELAPGNTLEQLTMDKAATPVPVWNPQPDWPIKTVAQFTASPINDLAPGFPPVGTWLLDADADDYVLTGIDAGDEGLGSRHLTLFNSSAFRIILADDNAGSLAVNRILNSTGINDVILPGGVWDLVYLPAPISRWVATPASHLSLFSRDGDPLLTPIPGVLTQIDLPVAEFSTGVDYTWTAAPTSIVTINRAGTYQAWVEVEAEVVGPGTGNGIFLLDIGLSINGAAPTDFAGFAFNRDGGDATVNTLLPVDLAAGTTLGLQARLVVTGSPGPVSSAVDGARIYLLRLSEAGDDVSGITVASIGSKRTFVIPISRERTLGDVRTIYRTAPEQDAWDTPNLTSSRFETGLAFALTAAYQNLPIGSIHIEESVYTYDGVAEDVEILEPGQYEISGMLGLDATAAGKLATAALLKNGVVLGAAFSNAVAQTGRIISLTPIVVTLAATDKISLGALSSSGGLLPDVTDTTLTIVKRRITA